MRGLPEAKAARRLGFSRNQAKFLRNGKLGEVAMWRMLANLYDQSHDRRRIIATIAFCREEDLPSLML